MADFQRYQPRRSQGTSPAWRRLAILAALVLVVVIVWRAMAGGSNHQSANGNSNADITLLTNDASGNTTTSDQANTNSTKTAAAPDTTTVDVKTCTVAIGSHGEAKRVALTFNVAAANDGAKAVLTALEKGKAAGSFFVTGTFVEKNPEFVKELADKGYGVYNRSYDNPKFTSLTAEEIATQLSKTDLAVADLTGRSTKPFFRAPYGDVNENVIKAVQGEGYCTILWTVDAYDWNCEATVDSSTQRVVKALRPGAIIMLSAGYDVTPDLVTQLITNIHKAGYELTSLAGLFTS